MDNQKLVAYANHMDRSPLRKYINDHEISVFKEEDVDLTEIDEIMKRNLSASERPINLVVLGEVKSGKSTFVNSFAKKLVSSVDVLEATATILELKYGPTENVVISMPNEDDITFQSLTDYHYYVEKNMEYPTLLRKIDKVSIYLPFEGFKKINLVDTPGLNTVTTENILKTDEYLVNADGILWILNAHHLGQRDIQSKIFKIRDLGKPIIGIINRIDEVDGNPQELMDYVQEEMGFLFSKVFLSSAKLAWEGTLEGDIKKIHDSRINGIFEYIVNNIEKKSDEFQKNTQAESSLVQLQRDTDTHKRAKKKLDTILQGADEKRKEMDAFHNALNTDIKQKIESWARIGLYTKELKEIRDTKSDHDFSETSKKYLNEAYFESIIQDKYQELTKDIYREWLTYKSEFIEIEKNSFLVIDQFDEISIKQNYSKNGLIADMKTGGLTVGTFGLGIAAYDALLAPWAAYYTLGLTTSVMVPPLLLAGVLAGGAYHFVTRNKKMEQRNQSLEDNISNIRSFFKSQIMNNMIENFKEINISYYEEAKNMIVALIEQGDTKIETLENLSEDISSYMNFVNVL